MHICFFCNRLVIVGFAYDAHEFLMKKMDEQDDAEEEGSTCCCCNMWKGIYLGGCLIVVILIAAGIIFMFARFSCALPLTMISVLCVATLLIILVSIIENIGQGLLVGVLVAAYAVFLTWSALSSYPNPQSQKWKMVDGKNVTEWVNIETCNPFLCDPTSANNTCNVGMMFLGILFSAVSVGWTGWRLVHTNRCPHIYCDTLDHETTTQHCTIHRAHLTTQKAWESTAHTRSSVAIT